MTQLINKPAIALALSTIGAGALGVLTYSIIKKKPNEKMLNNLTNDIKDNVKLSHVTRNIRDLKTEKPTELNKSVNYDNVPVKESKNDIEVNNKQPQACIIDAYGRQIHSEKINHKGNKIVFDITYKNNNSTDKTRTTETINTFDKDGNKISETVISYHDNDHYKQISVTKFDKNGNKINTLTEDCNLSGQRKTLMKTEYDENGISKEPKITRGRLVLWYC